MKIKLITDFSIFLNILFCIFKYYNINVVHLFNPYYLYYKIFKVFNNRFYTVDINLLII